MTLRPSPATVTLGFAVPSGAVVEIPLRHMAVCGQTQEAGKTTALEGLISRAAVRAITFITKRGEGSFRSARRIDPYFREQADWQFVASVLEASRGEKLKFERAWIIRASKGARTLADVHKNVRKAMETAKGLAGDVYLTLDAYLEEVVPAIATVRWAPGVELAAGVNAMDLTGLPVNLQHLVIKSSLDWVLEHGTATVVVVPEAWKFIPQGRGTPVKLAAAAFIRQGAGLKNYLWLDSQDLGGIEKEILRSVPVWILGVQREANEIKRTLENIPAGIAKPSKADIATLELGQFFACWGKHAVRTYAQPAWMPTAIAHHVATGQLDVRNATTIATAATIKHAVERAVARPMTSVGEIARSMTGQKEAQVTKEEAARLTRENAQLREENQNLRRRLEALEKGQHDPEGTRSPASVHASRESKAREDRTQHSVSERAARARDESAQGEARSSGTNGQVDEALYQAIKARLIAEAPALLRLLVEQPELEVAIERRIIEADGASTTGRVARLIKADWLAESRRFREILKELERTGTRINNKSLSVALQELVVAGFLTKEGVDRYRAVPDMKVRVVEAA
jgi:hypothetical protein